MKTYLLISVLSKSHISGVGMSFEYLSVESHAQCIRIGEAFVRAIPPHKGGAEYYCEELK